MKIVTSVSRIAIVVAMAASCHAVVSAQISTFTSSDPAPDPADDIIVTGIRATGITAAESAAPIKVLDEEMLSHVG